MSPAPSVVATGWTGIVQLNVDWVTQRQRATAQWALIRTTDKVNDEGANRFSPMTLILTTRGIELTKLLVRQSASQSVCHLMPRHNVVVNNNLHGISMRINEIIL